MKTKKPHSCCNCYWSYGYMSFPKTESVVCYKGRGVCDGKILDAPFEQNKDCWNKITGGEERLFKHWDKELKKDPEYQRRLKVASAGS